MAKRGNGEGSITQRKSDNRWMARITLKDGTRKAFYGQTRQEVAKKLAEAIRDRKKGVQQRSDERLRLKTYLEQWLEAKGAEMKFTSALRYTYSLRDVIDQLGDRPLARLPPTILERFYSYLRTERELAPTTIHHIHTVLKAALKDAVRRGLIAQSPLDMIRSPKAVRLKDIHPLTLPESKRFLAAIKGHHDEAIFALAHSTGMREGEILALRWRDLDWDHEQMHVHGTMHYHRERGGFWIETTKSDHSDRYLPVMGEVLMALRQWKVIQAEERLRAGDRWNVKWDGLMFTNPLGNPRYPSSLVKVVFPRLLEKVGLQEIRFHDLRHTAATRMIADGIDPKTVSQHLGHANVNITLDLYTHVSPQMQREASERYRRMLFS